MFNSFISRYEPQLTQTMQQVVDSFANIDTPFSNMIRYPMGWVTDSGQPYQGMGGKRVRPILLLLCADAVSNDTGADKALPAAAAVEILHNFSLVHDDIQDNSDMRHSRPTVWKVWGQPHAINVGDAMFALSYRAIEMTSEKGLPSDAVLELLRMFNNTILELTRGQYLDMSFETAKTVTPDEYVSMISGKTAALIGAAAQMGAYIGSQDRQLAQHYATFGFNLGIAFQIRDDILGIWGDASETGKSTATDILSRKKSLPVLYGLEHSAELQKRYQQETPFTQSDVDEVIQLLDHVGAHDYTQKLEQEYYTKAIAALNKAQPQGEAATQINQLIDVLFNRIS